MRIEYFVNEVMASQRRHDSQRRRQHWSAMPEQRSRRPRIKW